MVTAEASALGSSSIPVSCDVYCIKLCAKMGTANSAPYSAMPTITLRMLPAHSER